MNKFIEMLVDVPINKPYQGAVAIVSSHIYKALRKLGNKITVTQARAEISESIPLESASYIAGQRVSDKEAVQIFIDRSLGFFSAEKSSMVCGVGFH